MTVKGTPQNRKRKLSDTAAEPTSAKKAALTTPQSQSAQGKKGTPNSAKKGQTPQQQQQTPRLPNSGNKKSQPASNPKLPTPKAKAQTPKAKTPKKIKVEDDDEVDDDEETTPKLPVAKVKTPQKLNSNKVEKDDEQDDDDEDDDDDEEDDDDDEEDDDDDEEDDDEEESDEEEEAVQPPNKKLKQETGAKGKQNQIAQNKPPVKAETQKDNVDVARKNDRDAKTLFIKNLPGNCSVKEIKALSSDIKQVRLRINTKVYVKNGRTGYAYVEFGSEAAAEKNFPILSEASIRGNQLKVDYVGAKSINFKGHKSVTDEERDPLKLYLAGLPFDVTEADVRKLFPQAKEIILPIRKKDKKSFGYGFVTFSSPELAKQAHDKSQEVNMKGATLVVLYAKLKKEQPQASEKKKQQKKEKKKQSPAEKKPKVEAKKDEDEEEEEMDDDDEEDDEDDDEEDDDDDDDDDEEDDDDDEDDE